MQRSSLLLVAFSTLALSACGSQVIDQSGTTTGAGGSTGTTTTGAGGAPATTNTTTGTGGAPTVCGGKMGKPCGPDEFCKFEPDPVPCGQADGTGTCQPKPQGCTADCPGVCGCDGNFYCNACGANAAGVDVNPGVMCAAAAGDTYRAASMFTNAPRFALLKASPSRNLCFRLTVMPSQSTGIDIFGDGWSVMSAEVTSDVNDCDFPPGWPPPPVGASFQSMMGDGLLTFSQSSAGCVTGIHAKVDFTGGPAWAPSGEVLDADGLMIEGGCP